MRPTDRMSSRELRASLGLASVFGLRMLGMFIILPVFALYARTLPGGQDQTLVGLALGVYGLAQALLQLPLGWLSDRWGRKRVIYMGLIVFAAGSFVAAIAADIYGVILGRTIQGAGAISAAVIALTADLTSVENRTKSMAIIGMTIGAMFALSMVAGPVLGHAIGVPGLFALTGALALAAMAIVRFVVPRPEPDETAAVPARKVALGDVLRDAQLARLNFGIFALHAVLMALFVVVPLELVRYRPASAHWQVYLAVLAGSIAIMLPVMLHSERHGWQKTAFLGAVALIVAGSAVLGAGPAALYTLVVGLLLFFSAFNLLEASLPSLVSKAAPSGAKGTAVGVYSTMQFAGTFFGATTAGWIAKHVGAPAVFAFSGALALAWLTLAAGMRVPQRIATRRYQLPHMDSQQAIGIQHRLSQLPGVREVLLSAEGVAYLKVDSAGFDEQNVIRLLAGEN